MLAGVGIDVDVPLGREKALGASLGPLVAVATAMERDAALLVGDDDLHAILQHGRLKQCAVIGAALGIRPHHLDRLVLDHGPDDLLDLLYPRLVAEQVVLESRCGLLAGHRRGLVVEDDVGDVLAVLDRVRDRDLAAVEKRRVAHEDDLLVRDERVDAETGRAAEPHAAVIVHEVLVRLEHEHRVAPGVAMEDEVDRFAPVRFPHVTGIAELPLDLAQHAGRIAMRTARAKRRRTRCELYVDGRVARE